MRKKGGSALCLAPIRKARRTLGHDFISTRKVSFPFEKLPICLSTLIFEKMSTRESIRFINTGRFGSSLGCTLKPAIQLESIDIKSGNVLIKFLQSEEHSLEVRDLKLQSNLRTMGKGRSKIFCEELKISRKFNRHSCREITRFLTRTSAKTKRLTLTVETKCESEDLENVLKLVQATKLRSDYSLPKNFLNVPYASMLEEIELGPSCSLSDNEFLNLTATRISLPGRTLSAVAINTFLKQWKYGLRRLDNLTILHSLPDDKTPAKFLYGLYLNVIWSPHYHSSSIIAEIPISDIPAKRYRGHYSIWLSKDIRNRKRIDVSIDKFEFLTTDDPEQEVFKAMLSMRQYLRVFNKCPVCHSVPPCVHSRAQQDIFEREFSLDLDVDDDDL